MREITKQSLGIKPADVAMYAAYLLLLPLFYFSSFVIDIICTITGLLLCLASCRLGLKPHKNLSSLYNIVKGVMYLLFTLLFIFFVYLNFSHGTVI